MSFSGKNLHDTGNVLGLWGINFILISAFYLQITLNELPCPLCLLQRVAFVGVGLCFMANLVKGLKPQHYGAALLFTFFGLGCSVRQVLLHIVPGQETYGSPLFGFHLYTWSTLIFIIIAVCIGIALLIKGFESERVFLKKGLVRFSATVFLLLILLNAGSAFLECGISQCPDDPVRYKLLTRA